MFRGEAGVINDTVVQGEHLVTVRAYEDRMRKDFINEAVSREGIDPTKLEFLANRFRFFFNRNDFWDHVYEDVKYRSEFSFDDKLRNIVGRKPVDMIDWLNLEIVGGTTYITDSSCAVFLNLESICAYYVAEGLNRHVRQDMTNFMIHGIWRHEREHLIRFLIPKDNKVDKRTKIYSTLTALGVTEATIVSFFLIYDIGNSLSLREMALLLNLTIFSHTLGNTISHFIWYQNLNQAERKANEIKRTGTNLPNLFDIEFEKADPVPQVPRLKWQFD